MRNLTIGFAAHSSALVMCVSAGTSFCLAASGHWVLSVLAAIPFLLGLFIILWPVND